MLRHCHLKFLIYNGLKLGTQKCYDKYQRKNISVEHKHAVARIRTAYVLETGKKTKEKQNNQLTALYIPKYEVIY
jgi:hypothetical protein